VQYPSSFALHKAKVPCSPEQRKGPAADVARQAGIDPETRLSDFDVLADGVVVGRIFKANAAPVGSPWMWTLAFGHHEDRAPTHGYDPTREQAMAPFAKSWRRE
jgi:hypothetical protein